MKNSFDRVAHFYDLLAKLAFGKVWKEIQLSPAANLKNKNEILIVGGGTGLVLKDFRQHQHITYVELSSKMIKKARIRSTKPKIDFIHRNYLNWKSNRRFDAVLLAFFLDSFNEENLYKVIMKVKDQLNAGGEVHVLDFQRGTRLQNLLVWVMYLFFRITTRLESRELLDFEKYFRTAGFRTDHSETFLNVWVAYRIYKC